VLRTPVAIVLAFLTPLALAQGADAPAAEQAPERVVAGTVSLVEGDVRFLDANKQLRRPNVKDPIYQGDSIVTGKDGEVHLDMQDGGYIGVRPGTNLRIVNFKAEGGDDDGFLLNLLEGSFRAVTGWITRAGGNRRAEVQTPTATIGVRGTDYEPLVIPEGSKTGEAGTYNRVNIGETEMRTKEGSVIVKPNQAAFAPRHGALRPRLLDRVPAFFKTTRNEKRFEGLHQRIHQQLDQKRRERVKQIEQRRLRMKPAAQKAAVQKPAADARLEQRRREQAQREEALRQKRLQQARERDAQAQKQASRREAQQQAEERRRAVQKQQDHAKAAKKADHEERKRRLFDRRD
jgi:hypothetical protein